VGAKHETGSVLPEVTLLRDARGERPESAAGVGEFWYETEIWSLPISPGQKVLYASLCSHIKHGEINRKDLRATLQDSTDEDISAALRDLTRYGLLNPLDTVPAGYEVRSVIDPEG
jgi:hypothetical protein